MVGSLLLFTVVSHGENVGETAGNAEISFMIHLYLP